MFLALSRVMLHAMTTDGVASITTLPILAPSTALPLESPQTTKKTILDEENGEELLVVEPTDPDEDRLLQSQRETTQTDSEPGDPNKNIIATDPVLLSQIIQPLNTKTNNKTTEGSTQQPPRFLVTTTNNVVTLQPASAPPQTSFMVQPLSNLQAARLLNLPTPHVQLPNAISNSTLRGLLTANPLLYGVFMNYATANMLTQLANLISTSLGSFAQLVTIDKNIDLNSQIAEIIQLLSALINLATTLSTTLPNLLKLKNMGNSTAPESPPQANPILTSLIAVLPQSTNMSSSAETSFSNTSPPPPPPPPANIVSSQANSVSDQVTSDVSTISSSGKQSPPIAGLVTRSGVVLNSVRIQPRPKRFICSYSGCTRAFASRFNLVEHIRIHTGEKPFVCPEPGCSSRFKRSRDLHEHAAMHKKKRELTSTNTRKDLLLTSVLPSKVKLENNGEGNNRPRHTCPFPGCQRSYARRHRLYQHMSKHTGLGPFYCDHQNCNVRYFVAEDLERHKLVHRLPPPQDPVKKHVCPHENCGKAYSKLNKLREHVRSHTGERPYVCTKEGCTSAFSRPYGLKRHLMTHATARNTKRSKLEIQSIPKVPLATTSKVDIATTVPPAPVFPQTPTLISTVSSNSQPAIFNLVQALTNGVQLQPIVATSVDETPNTSTKVDPDPTPTPIVNTPRNVMITPVASSTPKVPLVQRSSKAAATPSASALAEKAIVISGPFGKRRHICPMPGCSKIFPKLNKLREHICRHTGERPYACQECSATFVRMYDLRRHALIHMRKRMGILNNRT